MGPTQLLITDLLKSPVAVRSASGPMPVAYVPYGYRPLSAGFTKIGFTGQLLELRGGHYLLGNGYRAYNPVLMRFHSPDHLSPFGRGGINAYTYCEGDPVNWRDLSGRNRRRPSSRSGSLDLTNTNSTGAKDNSSGLRKFLLALYEINRESTEKYVVKLSGAIEKTETLVKASRAPSGEPHSAESLKLLVQAAQMRVRRGVFSDKLLKLELKIKNLNNELSAEGYVIQRYEDFDIDQGYDKAIEAIEIRAGDELPPAYRWKRGSF